MTNFQLSVSKRSANKLATTNLTNELVDAINANATGVVGGVPGRGLLSAMLVRVDSKAGGKGKYLGVEKLGPVVTDEDSDLGTDLDDNMDDGQQVLILNQGELGSSSQWIPTDGDTPTIILAWIVGVMDDGRPIVWTNYNKSVRRIRLNDAETWVQVTYAWHDDIADYTDAEWVNAIPVGACDEGP